MATLKDLQQQYDAMSAKANRNAEIGYGFDAGLNNQMNALRNQMNQQAFAENSAASKTASDKAAADMLKKQQDVLDNTKGRGDATMNDAMTNAALQRLDSVSSGADAPFTQGVQNQMLSQQAGMNATAAGSQGEQLRQQAAALGGSTADPSYQARLRQVSANTQSANASAQGQIASTAQLQNFGARQQATTSMLSGRLGQVGMANGQYNLGAQYMNQAVNDGQHQSAVQPVTYNFNGGGSQAAQGYQAPNIVYQQNRATAQAPAAAPQQQAAAPVPFMGGYSNSTVATNRLQGPRPPDMNNAAFLASLYDFNG